MAYEWQSDIIRPDGENGTEILDGQGVYQPQIEGGDNITIENGRINASGTLENVQASWSETNPSDPSYIKNKPDLSIYATASGMETELAGKQDVISDLATIRSGAEAGSTAVQQGDLAAVATTGSYTSLSNTPQNIVQDANYVHTDNNFSNADVAKLSGIAAGAEVNVQSDWNEADSASDSFIKNKPTIPAAQQNADWNASSGVTAILNKPDLSAYATDSELTAGLATKQNVISDLDTIRSGASAGATAVQPSQLPSSDELVPSATSVDAGKVLTVGNDGTASWITPSAGTVYTAGDGIDITNDTISAKVGKGLEIDSYTSSQTVTRNLSVTSSSSETQLIGTLSSEIKGKLDDYYPITITTNRAYTFPEAPVGDVYLAIAMNGNPSQNRLVVAPAITVDGNNSIQPGSFTFDRSSVLSNWSSTTWNNILNDTTNEYDFIFFGNNGYNYIAAKATVTPSVPTVVATASFNAVVTIQDAINVANPIPTFSSSDNDKVLGVADGELAWTTTSVGPTYTAGNMIAIDANNSNAIGVSTTAGITDIQVVNALPASPVATVLYLIPEA